MAQKDNKVKVFSYKEIKEYVAYCADSFLRVRQAAPKNVLDIMDHFWAINKFVEEANERYKK